MSYSIISDIIQDKLNEKRKILSRQGSSAIYSPSDQNSKRQHQKNIIKTPYIIMVSTDKLQDSESNEIGNDDFFMLSNQEYSKNNSKINIGTDLYNARNLNSEDKVQYRPAPGIKDLSSEFISTNNTQFNRKVTVNFTCYSLADLEELNERFMSLSRKVYVQWGWATDEKITPLIKSDGKIDYSGSDPENKKSEITRLQEEVITRGQGDFDAVIGFVNNISFSLREDGGFDCTTELTAQGVNILDNVVEQGGEDNPEVIKKGLQYGNYSAQYGSFLKEINNLHIDALNFVGNTNQQPIYDGNFAAENVEITEDEEQNITDVTFKNLSLESKSYVYNENFILTKTLKDVVDSFNPDLDLINNKFQLQKRNNYKDSLFLYEKGGVNSNSNYNKRFNLNDNDPLVEPNECWVRWGWFEDNLLNKYFALYDAKDDKPVSYYRSIQPLANKKVNIEFERTEIDNIETRVEKAFGLERKGEVVKQVSLEVEDFESRKVPNKKEFITTDIKQFLFPGKFTIVPDLESIQKKVKRAQNDRNKLIDDDFDNFLKFGEVEGSKEYEILQAVRLAEQEEELALQLLEKLETIDEIKKEISKSGISLENKDEVTETGFDKFLFLYELERVLSDESTINSFNVKGENDSGYLRNIFINIGHLQSILGNANATTLGETMNVLFSSLAGNTLNEIDLITRYSIANVEETITTQDKFGFSKSEKIQVPKFDGRYGAEPRIPTEEPGYGENAVKAVEENKIYEFPVHQQDSIVLSQEISTDLTNTQMQVLMSKNLSAQLKKQLDKKGISPQHQQNFTQTNSDGEAVETSKYDSLVGLQPAFVKYGLNYGNPLGANPDVPIQQWTKNNVKLGDDSGNKQINDEETRTLVSNAEGQAKKDLEDASNTFNDSAIPYTIDGQLKSAVLDDLSKKLSIEVKTTTDSEGNEQTEITPRISDFGLIGLTTSLTLTGIAGIYPSNIFTTSYLPTKFKLNNLGNEKSSCHFWTTGVTQNCSAESWTTQIDARMAWRKVEVKGE